jgi:N-acetyl-gamma-glutamyl-phosphate reductase
LRVFIDGHAGTAGLRIRDWLRGREDLTLVTLPGEQRKNAEARRAALNEAELVVLCLPDEAAREALDWIEEPGVRVLDASTAHRVAPGWVYGLPELGAGQRARIASASRVTNPGCYPTGVILLLRPLVDAGLVPPETPVTVHALSGYSGGGRPLIERWEDAKGGLLTLPYPVPYALERHHKHLPEMTLYTGLRREPWFVPAVGPFRCGMRVEVPLHADWLPPDATAKATWETIRERYANEPFVRVHPFADPFQGDERTLDPRACNDTNRVELRVIGHPAGHLLLVACLDNLGKGAAGVAIQSLNLMLGVPEETGLSV